jgi:virginiamycin A acetyltransferase
MPWMEVLGAAKFARTETTSNPVAKLIGHLYPALPFKGLACSAISWFEGGQMRSQTLRDVLLRYHNVTVGAHSYGSLLEPGRADPGTIIGRYVSVGPGVRRIGAAHPIEATSLHPYWYRPEFGLVGSDSDVPRSGIVIENDCWIGADVIILPGCARIGVGAVIGAGSVVTRDVSDFSVVMGVPARQHSVRLSQSLRAALLEQRPWDHEPKTCRRLLDQAMSEDG